MQTDQHLIDWLLEEDEPAVRFRTMTELLGMQQEDPQVLQARRALPASPDAVRIFGMMHPDGYWLQLNPPTGEYVGAGVMYGSFASTHFVLSYLSELGLDRAHPLVSKAAERYLGLAAPDGDFLGHYSCLFGYNIRTFIRLGYRADPRLQKTIDLMLNTVREDGGYLCDIHAYKFKTKEAKSCIRGCVKTLLAFSEMPEYWAHPRCLQLVDYYRRHEGIFKSGDLSQPINKDVVRTTFPITWRAGITQVLYGLSRMGYGREPWLRRAWQAQEDRRDVDGRYILDWESKNAPLKPGKRGAGNKWVTLYALLAKQAAGV